MLKDASVQMIKCYMFAGRIGNTKEALVLITQELGDIEQAIGFCKEHDDMELWEDLIQYSLNKPGK
jgi:hypothetical protein